MTDGLLLDHFYAGIDPGRFEELKILESRIPMTEVRTSASGDESWTGIYLYSASGVYFEILKRDEHQPKAGLGLAFSGIGKESGVEAFLRNHHPDRNWTTKKVSRSGTDLWFLSVHPETREDDERVRTWAMEFGGAAKAWRQSRIGMGETPIRAFTGMEMTVPADLFRRLPEEFHGWIPARRKVEADRYEARIDCSAGESFTLDITPAPASRLPQVTRVHGVLKDGGALAQFGNDAVSIEVHGYRFSIRFSKYPT